MAPVDDKVRFYLERSVPQLLEFQAKEIFSKDEIRTLVEKRTSFERTILSPGAKPADVLDYIVWEEGLEALRRKRCQRLKIHQSTSHSSQARIFQTYERGVQRHPGSLDLWLKYLAFAEQAKATKRWRRIMTRALRMHPTNAQLWMIAGRKAVQDGNMESARSFYLRGCRFCTSDRHIWLAYAEAELKWLAKLKSTLDRPTEPNAILRAIGSAAEAEDDNIVTFDADSEDDEEGADDFSNTLSLPKSMTDAASKIKVPGLDQAAVEKLAVSPAMDGAIPQAVYDIAAKQPFFDDVAAESFCLLFMSYAHVPAAGRLADHVLQDMATLFPESPLTWSCWAERPLMGLCPDRSAFAHAMFAVLDRLKQGLDRTADERKPLFLERCIAWITRLVERPDMDSAIERVLLDTRQKMRKA